MSLICACNLKTPKTKTKSKNNLTHHPMKKDEYKTIVLFLVNETNKDFGPDLFAYFPFEVADSDNNKTSYSHVGQHSACHIEYAKESRLATKKEYENLFIELESIGYNLEIVTKIHTGNKLPWNGLKSTIEYKRQPTASEIKFGHGATHYLTVPKEKFLNKDGTIKSRIKHTDGLIYTY